jgi:hypothetical protein
VYMNALDKAQAGAEALAREAGKGVDPSSPFGRVQSLVDLFPPLAQGPGRAATQDALVDRVIFYSGLPEEERKRLAARLKLAAESVFTGKDGRRRKLLLLHGGSMSVGQSGIECSKFVSHALPADLRRGSFTTLDFRLIYELRKLGKFPRPPEIPAERERLLREVSRTFVPVDIYEGERLQVGDLLVFRLPWLTIGHVFVVRDYNPVTMRVEALEAIQGSGIVREREFPMSLSPMNAPRRYVRPGFLALRLKDDGAGRSDGCKLLREKKRAPASAKIPSKNRV